MDCGIFSVNSKCHKSLFNPILPTELHIHLNEHSPDSFLLFNGLRVPVISVQITVITGLGLMMYHFHLTYQDLIHQHVTVLSA